MFTEPLIFLLVQMSPEVIYAFTSSCNSDFWSEMVSQQVCSISILSQCLTFGQYHVDRHPLDKEVSSGARGEATLHVSVEFTHLFSLRLKKGCFIHEIKEIRLNVSYSAMPSQLAMRHYSLTAGDGHDNPPSSKLCDARLNSCLCWRPERKLFFKKSLSAFSPQYFCSF